MKNHIWIMILVMTFSLSLTAETVDSQAADIVLPPMYLEITDIADEQVAAFVPPAQDIPAPIPEFILPEPALSSIPAEVFRIPAPQFSVTGVQQGAVFYSEGLVGVGIHSYLLGDITLYKFGEGPAFDLRFLYTSLDGYGGNEAGTGFSDSRTQLKGNFSMDYEQLNWLVQVSYDEQRHGLQAQSDSFQYLSARAISGFTQLHYPIFPQVLAETALYTSQAKLLLTGADPAAYSEFQVCPEVAVLWKNDLFSLSWKNSYDYSRYADDASFKHFLKSRMSAEYAFPFALTIHGSASALYDFTQWRYPFNLQAVYYHQNIFQFQVKGGVEAVSHNFGDVWAISPFILPSPQTALQEFWFLESGVLWTLSEALRLDLRVRYESGTGFSYAAEDRNDYDLYPYAQLARELLHARVSLGFTHETLPDVAVTYEPRVDFINEDLLRPFANEHTVHLHLSWGWQKFAAEVFLNQSFRGEFFAPELQLHGIYHFSEDLKIRVNVLDTLAPVWNIEREAFLDYQQRGFQFNVETKISL